MKQPLNHDQDALPKPILPSWAFDRQVPDCLEDAGFSSGAGLALLHMLLCDPGGAVPIDLLRNRLALRAAVHSSKIEGRGVTEADLCDAYLLTLPGDAMGPDGDMLAFWRAGAAIGCRRAGWQDRLQVLLPKDMQEHLQDWVAGALLCADVILARSLGWDRPMPLFGVYVTRKTLRAASEVEDIRVDCHAAITNAVQDAIRVAHDLGRRAARLRAVAPKLRSKGSDDAVALFLSEDAVLPSTMLSPIIRGSRTPMTARSARRLCDRLVELGVVREMTGRATFRLYGLA